VKSKKLVRYALEHGPDHVSSVKANELGDYVTYTSYEALEAKLQAAEAELVELRKNADSNSAAKALSHKLHEADVEAAKLKLEHHKAHDKNSKEYICELLNEVSQIRKVAFAAQNAAIDLAKRSEIFVSTLRQIAAHKDEGNAEGYFGNLANDALTNYETSSDKADKGDVG